MQRSSLVSWVLALGLAFVFLAFGIGKFTDPNEWIVWIPRWFEHFGGLTRETWMQVIAVGEIIIGLLLVLPPKINRKVGAVLAVLHLLGVLTQTGWNDVAIRDIGLLCMALALVVMPKERN